MKNLMTSLQAFVDIENKERAQAQLEKMAKEKEQRQAQMDQAAQSSLQPA